MPNFNLRNPREGAINYEPRYDSKTLEDGSRNPEYQAGFFGRDRDHSDDDALSEWSSDFK